MSTQYKIGQAIIDKNDKLSFIETITEEKGVIISTQLKYHLPKKVNMYGERGIKRLATVQEILDLAKDNGWKVDEFSNFYNNTNCVWFFKHPDLEEYVINSDSYELGNYTQFGHECIEADRIIKALNLAPND